MAQVQANSIVHIKTETDIIPSNTNDGSDSSKKTRFANINPDIGYRNEAVATADTGDFSLLQLFQRLLQTLTKLLNATTLSTPTATTLTFTIASGTALSDYQQLVGRAWLIFFPVMTTGTTAVRIRVKKAAGDSTGELLYDDTASLHEFLVSSSATRTFSAQATAFLSAAIGSNIAFEADTNQTSAITIILKAVV